MLRQRGVLRIMRVLLLFATCAMLLSPAALPSPSLAADKDLAKRQVPYMPQTPPISPYFNYFRADNGGIPNFFQFVRPRQQYQAFLQRQTATNSSQVTRVRLLERQIQQLSEASSGAPSTAATFMNRSHFFPSHQAHPGHQSSQARPALQGAPIRQGPAAK